MKKYILLLLQIIIFLGLFSCQSPSDKAIHEILFLKDPNELVTKADSIQIKFQDNLSTKNKVFLVALYRKACSMFYREKDYTSSQMAMSKAMTLYEALNSQDSTGANREYEDMSVGLSDILKNEYRQYQDSIYNVRNNLILKNN